jgi:hypothetical protein
MKRPRAYAGFVLHTLIAAVMVYSAIVKFLELSGGGDQSRQPPGYLLPLAIAELANALLLLIPRTMSVGILITSAGWGAVTALAIMQAEDVVAPIPPLVPVLFLVITWIGGYLRDSRMLYSFRPVVHETPESKP